MNATSRITAVAVCLFALAACRILTPFPSTPLELDFTFPAADIFENLGEISGAVAVDGGETIALLTSEAELLFATFEGELIDRRPLSLPLGQSGLGVFPNGDLLIADQSGVLHRYVREQDALTIYAQLPAKVAIDAVAVDGSGVAYALASGEAVMYRIRANGKVRKLRIDPRFARYQITGLDNFDGLLLATGTDRQDNQAAPLAIAFEPNGRFSQAWEIGGSPNAVVVLEANLEQPQLLTADVGGDLLLWAPPPSPGLLDAPPLEYLDSFDLGEAIGAQPSGVELNQNDGDLYFVTDFARVLRASTDGTSIVDLFELQALQGTFEAIALNTAGNIEVLASDLSSSGGSPAEGAAIFEYDVGGSLLQQTTLEADGEVIQSYAIDSVSGTKAWATADSGVAKKLYLQLPGQAVEVRELPGEYTDYSITGIELAVDEALLLTEEREVDGDSYAGLLIIWDIEDAEELARFSVARPAADGLEVGVINPSDITLAPDGVLYVTSDGNNGSVYSYDLSALLD